MTIKITWRRTEDSKDDPDAKGYWFSVEGRFSISPNFWGRCNAQNYTVEDAMKRRPDGNGFERCTTHTVKGCKEWAQRRIEAEWAKRNR
jgi:hypothetical protein